jgi:hypothetical protein
MAGLEVTARKSGCIAAVVVEECWLYGDEDGDVIDPQIRGKEYLRGSETGREESRGREEEEEEKMCSSHSSGRRGLFGAAYASDVLV